MFPFNLILAESSSGIKRPVPWLPSRYCRAGLQQLVCRMTLDAP
jgi:hypothetical protein